MEEWRDSMNLREVLLDGLGEEVAPSTFNRGNVPIDSIMCLANIRIVKAGYLPFGEGAGDHRTLMIDIDETTVFGTAGTPSTKMRARRLKLRDPRIVKKYLNSLNKYYLKHRLFRKVLEMNNVPIQYPLQDDITRKYEDIDRIRVDGMRHAEKGCRKFHTGKIPWSPEISAAQELIELWTLVVRRLRE